VPETFVLSLLDCLHFVWPPSLGLICDPTKKFMTSNTRDLFPRPTDSLRPNTTVNWYQITNRAARMSQYTRHRPVTVFVRLHGTQQNHPKKKCVRWRSSRTVSFRVVKRNGKYADNVNSPLGTFLTGSYKLRTSSASLSSGFADSAGAGPLILISV
jgi:hypothetical protein